jgi:hypothetical protein
MYVCMYHVCRYVCLQSQPAYIPLCASPVCQLTPPAEGVRAYVQAAAGLGLDVANLDVIDFGKCKWH